MKGIIQEYSLLLRLQYYVFLFIMTAVARMFFRVRVVGRENISYNDRSLIIISQHRGLWDIVFQGIAFGWRKPLRWVARKGLALGLLYAYTVPINRENPEPEALREVVRRLRAGEWISVFPQGGTTPGRPLMRGIVMFARRSRARFLPVNLRITGPYARSFIRFAYIFQRVRVVISIGSPISLDEICDIYNIDKRDDQRIVEVLMQRIDES